MYWNGLWKIIPTPTSAFRVVGEAFLTLQARPILQLTVTTALALTTATTSVSVFHFSRKS